MGTYVQASNCCAKRKQIAEQKRTKLKDTRQEKEEKLSSIFFSKETSFSLKESRARAYRNERRPIRKGKETRADAYSAVPP